MWDRRDGIEFIEAKKEKNVFVYVKHKSFVFVFIDVEIQDVKESLKYN